MKIVIMKAIFAAILLAAQFLPIAAAAETALVEVGENDFQISVIPNDAFEPAVAYNPTVNEYLVVWRAIEFRSIVHCDVIPAVMVKEIWGQRFNAQTGAPAGDQVRISTYCNPERFVKEPAVVYNGTDNEYLVVWAGEREVPDNSFGDLEIFGQLLDATLSEVGSNDFRISDMGGLGDNGFTVGKPAVSYNSTENEYFVVWQGTDNEGGLVGGEFEIFGQRLDHDGGELGGNDIRISDMNGIGNIFGDAFGADVTYNPVKNEYLVVWYGRDNPSDPISDGRQVFAQRLNENGAEQGANDIRISDTSGIEELFLQARQPAVTYNSVDNEYLVVWQGDDDVGGLVDDEIEIFGQRLDENAGEVGVNDFRISDMGGTGDDDYFAASADVTHNPAENEYLVVWYGDDNEGGLFDGEREIFGQRLDKNGAEKGANDFRISDMGGTGTNPFNAFTPAVAYDTQDNEYLVVWRGDDDENNGVDDEFNIFGQRLRVILESIFDDGFE